MALICWLAEFFNYLKHNVLIKADLDKHLHTVDLSDLGHSFYLVVGGIVFVIVNLLVLSTVLAMEKKERRFVRQKPIEEKTAEAIMLY